MDIKQRVMDDQPNSIFHKIASIVPGYKGYVDRERRRDADKLLRTHLAKEYSAQRDRLTRVQQGMARAHRYDQIGELDRISGVFQRFIDRLNTATYGYTGMFDPIKIEAPDLDQLYAFDAALATGVDDVSKAIDQVDSASTSDQKQELSTALSRLADLVDQLNERLNQRSELLTSGTRLPQSQYQALVSGLQSPDAMFNQGQQPAPQPGQWQPGQYAQPGQSGTPTTAIPATDFTTGQTFPPPPGVSQIANADQGFAETPSNVAIDQTETGTMPTGGAAGTGLESASSPAKAPGGPAEGMVSGLSEAGGLESIGGSGEPPMPGGGAGNKS